MPRPPVPRARFIAGAFLLLAGSVASADPLRIAAQRPDAGCPSGRVLGIVSADARPGLPEAAGCCLVFVRVSDLSDAALDDAASRIAGLAGVAGYDIEIQSLPAPGTAELEVRLPYAIKLLSSTARAASPAAQVAFDLTAGAPSGTAVTLSDAEDLGAYADALVIRPGRGKAEIPAVRDRWILEPRAAAGSAPGEILRILDREIARTPSITLVGLLADPKRPLADEQWASLERLQSFWTADVSHDPTPTRATRGDGSAAVVLRFFDAKAFTPILFLPEDPAGAVSIELSGGPFAKASVLNLETGAQRDFDLTGAASLSLDLSRGPLAAVLHPAARSTGEARAEVEVGAERRLTAEEIIARERAWDAGQREKTKTFIADLKTSLRFRVADVNETFDLTIRGPFYFERGGSPDWSWHEFYLNGVRWKGRTLPKLPILQPEKVTTLPLDIRLTEDYAYALKGVTRLSGRRAYEIAFTPKASVGEKPIYHGTAWIDAETFALLRRDSVQENLKGETLSNVQSEIYRPVPGRPDVVLPLQIKGQQVFSTAGRTTAIERDAVMSDVRVNPPDFAARRAAEYSSQSQMIRDTPGGLRYLMPDPARPGERVVEEKVSRKSTFGLLGGFYDNSLDYPIPLLGIQHFNFDLWGKGKQISLFFGGALLTLNYTDPAFAGSRLDLGADLFAVAFAFGDVPYRNGNEITGEKIKHLPAVFQANVGYPLGPYLKASLGLFSKWDNYQRDKDTQADFVTPVDTFTNGAEARLVANVSGFNATLTGSYASRASWPFWGLPDNPDYSPSKKDYWKYSLSLSKDQYFSGFRKLHVSVTYLGGTDLDRFSKYEFGTFSGHAIHGYQSGSLRSQDALLMNVSYGLNIENIIRFEGFYDQALLRDDFSGFHDTYFSGAGLIASLNGPWQNSLFRGEIGIPVVGHGVHGVVVALTVLKLF
ncbi:MAG: hypothetical protein ACM3SU_17300 [Acidobacteriota bacterium]